MKRILLIVLSEAEQAREGKCEGKVAVRKATVNFHTDQKHEQGWRGLRT